MQTKLVIGVPGDIYEREADRMAEQVMRRPQLQRACQCGGECRECDSEEQGAGQIAAPPIVHAALRSPGRPLDATTRASLEPRFGRDFSRVRIHTGHAAEQSAKAVNAEAYTVGHDVVFGAGKFAPETDAGRRLLAHELTHVVQQSDTQAVPPLQRKPIKNPDVKPIPALQPLEVVARDVANLILKNYSREGIAAGPVLTAVLDEVTHKIYIGLNSGIPPQVVDVVRDAIQAQKDRIKAGEVIVLRTDPLAQGGHSEANAVNEAVRAREDLLKRKVTEVDLRTFELHNIWLKGADRKFTAAPRCEHCARITRSVSVTSSVFFAEGGVSGTIKPLPAGQRIPRVGPGGATGTIAGEITVPDKPPKAPLPAPTTPRPTTSSPGPRRQPPAEHPVEAEGARQTSPASLAPAFNAAADLLSVIFGPYIFPGAKEAYQKRFDALRAKLQPSIQARIDELLRTETPRIAQLGSGGRALYITVKLTVWTQHSDVVGAPPSLVDVVLDDVMLGTKNINEKELSHSLADAARCSEVGHCKSYELYSIPVPAAIQQEAIRRLRSVGASELENFNRLADNLKDSRLKARMAGAINLARLAKDNAALRAPAIQQLIPVLRDDDDTLRGIAALALGVLGATEAIPAIRQALANTDDDRAKAVMQKNLDRLEEIKRGSK
jgi:hypothetical protein